MFGHDQQIELGAADPGILDLRGNGMPTASAPDRQRRHRCIPAAGDDQIGPGRVNARTVSPAARNGKSQSCGGRQTQGKRIPRRFSMKGNPAASARPSAWLAIPALPSCKTQATGDGRFGTSSERRVSVGAAEAIAPVYANGLWTARMPLGYTMTVSAQVGLWPGKSESPSAKGDGDDLIGFGAARGGNFDAVTLTLTDQRARER